MKHTLNLILVAVATSVVVACKTLFASRPHRMAFANTWEEKVPQWEDAKQYKADEAISTRHLLYKQGSDADHITLSDATSLPLGPVDNEDVDAEDFVAVLLMGRGKTKKLVAAGAIAAGVRVFSAAGGKVAATGSVYLGVSATAAAQDGDLIGVNDIVPLLGAGAVGASHMIVAAGIHTWAGGAATTDSIPVAGLLATDVIHVTLVARNSTQTLAIAVNDDSNDQIDVTLSANGADGTCKLSYSVLRAI